MKNGPFLGDVMLDRVLLVATNLAEEVYVAIERLRTLEMVLVAKNMIRPDELEEFEPSANDQEEIRKLRDQFVARIFDGVARPASERQDSTTASGEVQ